VRDFRDQLAIRKNIFDRKDWVTSSALFPTMQRARVAMILRKRYRCDFNVPDIYKKAMVCRRRENTADYLLLPSRAAKRAASCARAGADIGVEAQHTSLVTNERTHGNEDKITLDNSIGSTVRAHHR
jgi:hypothetical protein